MAERESLGAPSAPVVLYTHNRPIWELGAEIDVPQLILKNGNHWRKICTIFAKLVAGDNWRDYRDQQLFHVGEQINFEPHFVESGQLHIISGKSNWLRFGRTLESLQGDAKIFCLEPNKIFYTQDKAQNLYLFTPYFDSRQFPNVLIERVKQQFFN